MYIGIISKTMAASNYDHIDFLATCASGGEVKAMVCRRAVPSFSSAFCPRVSTSTPSLWQPWSSGT